MRNLPAALLPLLLVGPALGQDIDTTKALEDIETLRGVINWTGVMLSLLLVGATWGLLRLVDDVTAYLTTTFTARRMLLQKLRALIHFTAYLAVGIGIVLLSFNLSDQVLALAGGSAAVAIGFGIKDLAASLIAGITIMADAPFQVGDRVSFQGHYGDITSIGLRSVRLQTLDDNTVTIPNNLFLSSVVSSGNFGALEMQVVIDFHIGVDQDVRLARDLAREAVVTSRFVCLKEPVVLLVKRVLVGQLLTLRVRVKAYVLDTQYEKAYETDVTLRVLDAFAEHDIAPPALLHRSLDGDSKPS